MSREIKFRAWDKETEQYYKVLAIDFERKIVSCRCFEWEYGPSSLIDLDDLALEQFTGLKDQNGKPIYEGDIIKYFGANKRIKIKTTYGRVFYDSKHGCFNSRIQNEEHGNGGVTPLNDLVVGNIHENRELLEAEK